MKTVVCEEIQSGHLDKTVGEPFESGGLGARF